MKTDGNIVLLLNSSYIHSVTFTNYQLFFSKCAKVSKSRCDVPNNGFLSGSVSFLVIPSASSCINHMKTTERTSDKKQLLGVTYQYHLLTLGSGLHNLFD